MNIDKYLDKFDKFTKDPTLEAMKYIMDRFDNPEKNLKIIHVAGTNGKGSVCEMLGSILSNTKYKVGKFISPHLIKFNDGIYINNIQISNKEVEEIIIPLSKVVDDYNKTHEIPVKWFEVITSLVLIYFAKNECDFAILETGLGGETDCTNIVDSMISIITNIGYDHVDVLGDSIESITKHKAGIIKKNSDTIFVKQKQEINSIIEAKCKKENTKLHLLDSDEDIKNYKWSEKIQEFDFKQYKNIRINLKGKKQVNNAIEVLECISILKEKGYEIPSEAIKIGLENVIHKARLETLSTNPLIVFDGGHNENAIKNLMDNINLYYKNSKRVYIISILKTKDYRTIVKNICEDKDSIFIFTSGNDKNKYISKEELYNVSKEYLDLTNIYQKELLEAINFVRSEYSERAIFIVGSFYVYKTIKGNI